MNQKRRPALSPLLLLFASVGFACGATAQHGDRPTTAGIHWVHALDAVRPASGATDSRPIILYFTFDT